MDRMFYGADAFNQPVGSWDTSSVKQMDRMFYGADAFNQSLQSWNTDAIATAQDMFSPTSLLKQPPCPSGEAPSTNGLVCELCPPDQLLMDSWGLLARHAVQMAHTTALIPAVSICQMIAVTAEIVPTTAEGCAHPFCMAEFRSGPLGPILSPKGQICRAS